MRISSHFCRPKGVLYTRVVSYVEKIVSPIRDSDDFHAAIVKRETNNNNALLRDASLLRIIHTFAINYYL